MSQHWSFSPFDAKFDQRWVALLRSLYPKGLMGSEATNPPSEGSSRIEGKKHRLRLTFCHYNHQGANEEMEAAKIMYDQRPNDGP